MFLLQLRYLTSCIIYFLLKVEYQELQIFYYAVFFQILVWRAETFGQILIMYSIMSMFFYGSAAVKFAYLAEVFPTPVRATAMAVCGSFAVTLGSAAGPYYVSLAVEAWGWNLGYAMLTGIPLMLAGLLYLALDSLPSGLEIEEIETIYRV